MVFWKRSWFLFVVICHQQFQGVVFEMVRFTSRVSRGCSGGLSVIKCSLNITKNSETPKNDVQNNRKKNGTSSTLNVFPVCQTDH